MARKALIIGEAVDVFGLAWDVRESRPTAHGFEIKIGWPKDAPRGKGGRGIAMVPTAKLIEYLAATRLKDVVLPASLTAIKRLSKDSSIAWIWDDWWKARETDLRTLTLEAFAKIHQCSIGAASQRRAILCGCAKRPATP